MKKIFTLFLFALILFNFAPTMANTLNVTTASYSIVVNGEKWESENPIISINGKTYIPLTEIGDLLDVDVSWNEKKRQVEICNDASSENSYEKEKVSESEETNEEKTYSSYLEWLMDWYGIEDEEESEESEEVEEESTKDDYSFSLDWLWSWDDDSQIKVSYGTESSSEELESSTTTSNSASTKNYVASKSGSKYHIATCSSAKKIKSANKTYFASEAKAKSAGYSACSICIK